MKKFKLSSNGQKLIHLYEAMANEGYNRTDGVFVETAFSDFELKKFRKLILLYFTEHEIKSVLDYGGGGSDWGKEGFDQESNKSAIDFFFLDKVATYEPARNIDQRQKLDCVICMDVLEHVFVVDVPTVLRDICSYADNSVVLNIGCYEASATLPNGENAHITIRDPLWWKGMLDSISIEFPKLNILLLCAPTYQTCKMFQCWKADDWENSTTFRIDLPEVIHLAGPEKVDRPVTLTKEQMFNLILSSIEETPEMRIEYLEVIGRSLNKN